MFSNVSNDERDNVVLTAMHSTKPVPRRDVREIARGQIAVGFESVLYSKALRKVVSIVLVNSCISA
jgi:hypothetical protein